MALEFLTLLFVLVWLRIVPGSWLSASRPVWIVAVILVLGMLLLPSGHLMLVTASMVLYLIYKMGLLLSRLFGARGQDNLAQM